MTKGFFVFMFCFALVCSCYAQVADTLSPVKSISSSQYSDYKNGLPGWRTEVAEVNHYPGPRMILENSSALKLSSDQKSKLEAIAKELDRKAKEMGGFIINEEAKLDALFASGKVNEGSLIFLMNKLGLYEGELRNAYLQAHLKTQRILTPDQVNKYYKLAVQKK